MCAKEGMIEWDQLEPMLTEIEEAAINIERSTVIMKKFISYSRNLYLNLIHNLMALM